MKSYIKNQKSATQLRSQIESQRILVLKRINEIDNQYQLYEQLDLKTLSAQKSTKVKIKTKPFAYQVKQTYQSKNLQEEVQNFKICLDKQYKNSLRQLSFDPNGWKSFYNQEKSLRRNITEETKSVEKKLGSPKRISNRQLSNRICHTEVNEEDCDLQLELMNQQRKNKLDKQRELAKKINVFMNRILYPQNIIINRKKERENKLFQSIKQIQSPMKNKVSEYYPTADTKLKTFPKPIEGFKNWNKQIINLIDQQQAWSSRSTVHQRSIERKIPSIIIQEPLTPKVTINSQLENLARSIQKSHQDFQKQFNGI